MAHAILRIMSGMTVEVFVPESRKPDGNFDGHWTVTKPEAVKKGDLFRWKDWNLMKQQRAMSIQKQAEHVHIGFDPENAETKAWGV